MSSTFNGEINGSYPLNSKPKKDNDVATFLVGVILGSLVTYFLL